MKTVSSKIFSGETAFQLNLDLGIILDFYIQLIRVKVLVLQDQEMILVKKFTKILFQDLLGRSLFDIIHPEDAEILKTQLLSSDHGPRERLIDIKTGVSIKTESSPSFLSSAGSRKMFYNFFNPQKGFQIDARQLIIFPSVSI